MRNAEYAKVTNNGRSSLKIKIGGVSVIIVYMVKDTKTKRNAVNSDLAMVDAVIYSLQLNGPTCRDLCIEI